MHHHHHSRGGITITPGARSGAGVFILYFTALLLLGMAVLFFMVTDESQPTYLGFMITAGILAPVGLLVFVIAIAVGRSHAKQQRVRATGIPGQARIVGMTQTGTYVNYQPMVVLQLQVVTAMHAPYLVSRREIVPQIMTGLLTSGTPLPVMVDPARPDYVVIVWEVAMNPPPQFGIAPPQGFGAMPMG